MSGCRFFMYTLYGDYIIGINIMFLNIQFSVFYIALRTPSLEPFESSARRHCYILYYSVYTDEYYVY